MRDADVVVVGGGHNALVTAAYVAAAGLEVLVLEGQPHAGGDAQTEALTLPGFRHDACASAHTIIQSNPMLTAAELPLERFGLRYIKPDPVFTVPFLDGESLTMYRDPERTAADIARRSPADARAYRQLLRDWEALRPIQSRERNNPPKPPDEALRAWRDGDLGDEGLRIRMASGIQMIRERFSDPYVQAFIAWVATMTLDDISEPFTGVQPFSLTAGRQQHSWTTPEGGSGALPDALVRFIRAAGGEVVTGAWVRRIHTRNGRAVAVETADGTRYEARRAVVSSAHVQQLPALLGESLPEAAGRALATWTPGLTMFVTHYALSELPRYRQHDHPGGQPSVAMGAVESIDNLLDVFGRFRRGLLKTDRPFLLCLNSSFADPTRCPSGYHTLKVVGIQPYNLVQGPEHWDAIKEEVSDALLDAYLGYTVNLRREHIVQRFIESPLDLERRNPNNYRGSCHGGASGPDQTGWFRPFPAWNGYRTDVEGLYLTGACTHPGGSISGIPGRNTARVLLEDLGLSWEGATERARTVGG
jgi:phytoene dehydrogenase-like protein